MCKAVLAIFWLLAAAAHGQSVWTAQKSLPTEKSLFSIAYGGSQFVVVGEEGSILSSPDGTTWTNRSPGAGNSLASVAFGASLFVAVGQSGSILTSPDGTTWTATNSGTASHLSSVTYGGSQFMAVGHDGTVLASPDGISWTSRNLGTATYLTAVTHGAARFVAVEWGGGILTSSDGINWTNRDSGQRRPLYAVAFGNSRFVALGSEILLTSLQDGVAVLAGPVARGISLRLTSSHLFASYPGFSRRPVHAVIFTARGDKVMEVWGRGDGISLPIGGLAPGVYALDVASGKERAGSRFVKR